MTGARLGGWKISLADGYDAVYAAWPASPTLQGIWRRNALGPDDPVGVRAHQLPDVRGARVDQGMRADFVVATASAVALAAARAHGVLSVDALQYVPDKRAALLEVGRVLAPGGRFVSTAFELDPDRVADLPVLGTDAVADYAPLLEDTGFSVESNR